MEAIAIGTAAVDWTRRSNFKKLGGAVLLLIVLLNLALDATAIWSVANRRQEWTDVLDQLSLNVIFSEIHSGLDDIVREVIAKKLLELGRWDDLADEHTLALWGGTADALLDDVRTELLPG